MCLLLFEIVSSWSCPQVVGPVVGYHNLSHSSTGKQVRCYFQDFMACAEHHWNYRAYFLLMLGNTILRHIGATQSLLVILSCFETIWEDLGGSMKPQLRSVYDSVSNVMWNAVVFAGIYTQFYAPERVLHHDWLMSFPMVGSFSCYNKSQLFPLLVAAKITCHYTKLIQTLKQSTFYIYLFLLKIFF